MVVAVSTADIELYLDEHGILQLRWPRQASIRTRDAEAAMHRVNTLCGHAEHPLLVDMRTTVSVSRGARTVFARTCQASRVALLGASPVDKVIANFVLAINKTPCSKRFFTSQTEAMAWLLASATA